jgi:PAS domain S-box-containing protein
MSGMLEEEMLNNFDGLPLNLDNNNLDDATCQEPYTALNPSIPHMETEQGDGGVAASAVPNTPMRGAGAGPLPTGFGAQSTLGSTLIEFTKRRNWSQRVVEELKDLLLILTPDGRILYLSPSGKSLTGFAPEELVGKFIIDFIHKDDSGIFMREFNESITTGNPLRFFYRFRKKDGLFTIFESHGHPHLTSEAAAFGPNNSAGFCRGFFMMARPYPTKNAGLLDSFLEHKIENERLTKRINDLKREEAEEAEESQRHWQKQKEGRSEYVLEGMDTLGGTSATTSPPERGTNLDVLAMPPPAKPTSLNSALTRQNLEDANASSKPDSINDKMARYEGATHIETIEMLTGLRYQDGERSQGISTGDQSPALIRGDAGIAIPVDKEARAGDKKKKIKLPDEYVCTDCGKHLCLFVFAS